MGDKRNLKKLVCKFGHPLFGDNLAIRGGDRVCKECSRAQGRAARERAKARAAADLAKFHEFMRRAD